MLSLQGSRTVRAPLNIVFPIVSLQRSINTRSFTYVYSPVIHIKASRSVRHYCGLLHPYYCRSGICYIMSISCSNCMPGGVFVFTCHVSDCCMKSSLDCSAMCDAYRTPELRDHFSIFLIYNVTSRH
jgi:hypothetical protein